MSVKNHDSKNCLGCKWNALIPEDYKIDEKYGFVINHSTQPVVFGHIIVMVKLVGKKMPISIAELEENDYNNCLKIVRKIAKALPEVVLKIRGLTIAKVYIASLNEDTDWHPHVHIIPRGIDIPDLKRGQRIFDLPQPYIPKVDILQLKKALKQKLS